MMGYKKREKRDQKVNEENFEFFKAENLCKINPE